MYTLGKVGAVRLLASGLALALAAQSALFWGSLVVVLARDYRGNWYPTEPEGFIVGFCAAALFGAAGVLGRRSS